ncbi:MAG: 1,4-alpha-glucan branching protein GlgB [Atopobiaceae bacterium]|jgi:1,4-alpha-glucan branching enzyme
MVVGTTSDGFDAFSFHAGTWSNVYRYLGAHMDATVPKRAIFRLWAPAAQAVTLVLHHNWRIPLMRVGDATVWETTVDGVDDGMAYEYEITIFDGSVHTHADPYAFGSELRPKHRSVVRNLWYEWQDADWCSIRARSAGEDGSAALDGPLNIYEVNLASWRRKGGARTDWYTYDEIAPQLIGHMSDAGYNCVEFMPLSEHPLDESWGYQGTGFFSPTSRFGNAWQLKRMVDELHRAHIACIMDFVPVHFAADAWGLADFDGTKLYEYPTDELAISEWGSRNFMLSRPEVQSFLISAARWWLEEFHFDGLRMDAVSRMLYWGGDPGRGVNEAAVSFVRRMNAELHRTCPGCVLIAEDSSTYPAVTGAATAGGLGFDYKWDMGWINDTTDFFRKQDFERREHYGDILFSMHYFPSERWVLPLSHDENVYGKSTLVGKCFGPWPRKFASARVFYLYMATHPGKKLTFMGSEWAQLREWDARRLQDWDLMDPRQSLALDAETAGVHAGELLADGTTHLRFYQFMRELNHLYLTTPALWKWDFEPAGFTWISLGEDPAPRLIYAYERRYEQERMVCVLNVGEAKQRDVELFVPQAHSLELIFSTDWERFGGLSADPVDRDVQDSDASGREVSAHVTFAVEYGRARLSIPGDTGFILRVCEDA